MNKTLSEENIELNKQEFLRLVNDINREGVLKDELINMLETSDFFYAPASTKYHGSYCGGLCKHSLDVYNRMFDFKETIKMDIDSVKIVSLFHDISKINLYKKDIRNKKLYYEYGSKSDNIGRFDWVSEEIYIVDHDNKFVYGNHEQTSEFLVRQYFPLTVEESVALLHHHGGLGWDSTKADISEIYSKYPLAVLLHSADLMASFLDKNIS